MEDVTPRAAPSPRLLAAVLAAGTALLFARVARHGYVFYDDTQYVFENPRVLAGLTWDNVEWAFSTLHFSNWHPLTWLSYMLDVELFGPSPGAMHLVNVAVHAANAALLFLVLERMTGARGRSALVAALFAVHPVHVESVAWIAERKDVLSTAFGLLALGAYARFAARPGAARYALVALCFALSLMAKPMLVTLPFLLLLLDGWPLQRVAPWSADPGGARFPPVSWRAAVLEKLPLLAMAVASSAVAVAAQARGGAVLELPLAARLANAAVSYVRYVGKIVWPSGLAVFYPHPLSGYSGWAALGALAALSIATALALRWARTAPWLAVGWLWFLGTLVPVIGVVQVGAQAMADRYTYVPAIGLFVAVTWAVERAAAARLGPRGLALAGAVVLVALSAATWRQLGYWRDHETLFRHAIAVTGENARAHGALAIGLRHERRLPEALSHAREAARLEPDSGRHLLNVGVIAREMGLQEESVVALRRAVEVAPDFPNAWRALSDAERDAGRPAEAMAALEQALRIDAGNAEAWGNLAVLRQAAGRLAEAGEAFEAAARADPGSAEAWGNLGLFHAQAGRPAEATRAFREGVRADPGNARLLRLLAVAQLGAGDRAGALATLEALARIDPASAAQVRALAGP